ncbi:hypothetical protein [Methylosinus sp. Ce-a6]|uniref:hypothetical protein n=1 Tax=Methylosinus sp. Ce-a6 TaxID=2172005 RepID=UPI0013597F1F|nr:hypothetical protein [Methylosinus sp. Ce-a6]
MSLALEVNGFIRNSRKTSSVYDLNGLFPTMRSGMNIETTAASGMLTSLTLYDDRGQIYETAIESDIAAFWQLTEGLCTARTTYRAIKANADWQGVHAVGQRAIFYEINGGALPVVQPATVVCKRCNVVMTLEAATIDHRHPQSGGERQAARRVFRAVGLTQQHARHPAGRIIEERSPFKDRRAGFPGGSLSYLGVIFFTCIKIANKYEAFAAACIHHLVNLEPLCFRCNSSKGAWGY